VFAVFHVMRLSAIAHMTDVLTVSEEGWNTHLGVQEGLVRETQMQRVDDPLHTLSYLYEWWPWQESNLRPMV
jgi:hypothetical protein